MTQDAPHYVPLGNKAPATSPQKTSESHSATRDDSYMIQLLEEINSKIESLAERLDGIEKAALEFATAPKPKQEEVTKDE